MLGGIGIWDNYLSCVPGDVGLSSIIPYNDDEDELRYDSDMQLCYKNTKGTYICIKNWSTELLNFLISHNRKHNFVRNERNFHPK